MKDFELPEKQLYMGYIYGVRQEKLLWEMFVPWNLHANVEHISYMTYFDLKLAYMKDILHFLALTLSTIYGSITNDFFSVE